jgi:hypothetical protein
MQLTGRIAFFIFMSAMSLYIFTTASTTRVKVGACCIFLAWSSRDLWDFWQRRKKDRPRRME